MSGYKKVNYYELCRLCASSHGDKVNIFEEDGRKIQLLHKIQINLHLQISYKDSLPKMVCSGCVKKLESFSEFRTSCLNAEVMLQGYFDSLKTMGDFVKEAKVYVKDVPNEKNRSIEDSETTPTEQEVEQVDNLTDFKTTALTSVPVTLESLSTLVQAGALHILPNSDPVTKDARGGLHTNDIADSSLHEIAYSTNGTSGQNVILQIGYNKDKDVFSSIPFLRTDDLLCRNAIQLSELIRLKPTEGEPQQYEEAVSNDVKPTNSLDGGECSECGNEVKEEDRTDHALTCPGNEDNVNTVVANENKWAMNKAAANKVQANELFDCDVCHKVFKRREHLLQHKKLHTGERPFVCTHCGRSFSRKEHLVRHSVSHTGQKMYSCDICGKSFGRKDNVRKHRKTHCLEGPYECEKCGKRFVVKPYYLMHKASHCKLDRGEYSHKCSICDKGFTSKNCLKNHVCKHHSNKSSNIKTDEVTDELNSRDILSVAFDRSGESGEADIEGQTFNSSSGPHDEILLSNISQVSSSVTPSLLYSTPLFHLSSSGGPTFISADTAKTLVESFKKIASS